MIDKIGSRQWQQAKLQDSRNSFFDLKIGPIHQATQIVCANCLAYYFSLKRLIIAILNPIISTPVPIHSMLI